MFFIYKMLLFQFYILETALELYARHILFLTLSLELQKRMGLQGETVLPSDTDNKW